MKPRHDTTSELTEGQRLGAYRIVRLLGEGGMGAVYEARQEPLDRRVALKTLHAEYAKDKDSISRFFNEAKVLSRLEHPSIVQVSDFGNAEDGTAYLVMEYLRGQSLGRRLRDLGERGERLSTLTALQLCFQIADVLAVAHAQGIVHRDIKPDNLMLVADPIAPGGERVKLLDFGIAKLTNEHDKGGVKTATQQVMGTPTYMSPEQCAGAGGVDARTDVYALGCVLYEALAGRPPFVADGAGRLIGMHLFQEPPPLLSIAPKVPQSVSALIHRMLTKDKTQRPSMTETADEIAKLLSKQSGSGPIVRSRPHTATDPDATKAIPIVPQGTTLGKSIGQRVNPPSRSRFLFAAGIALSLGIGFQLWPKKGTQPVGSQPVKTPPLVQPPIAATPREMAPGTPQSPVQPTPEKEQTLSPATPAPSLEIRWKIESTPSGSSVYDDKGKKFGETPLDLRRSSEPGTLLLKVRKLGYVETKLSLRRDQSETKQVTLVQNPPESVAKPSPKPTPTPKPLAPKPAPSRIGFED